MLLIKVPYIAPKKAFGITNCGEYNFGDLIPLIISLYIEDDKRDKKEDNKDDKTKEKEKEEKVERIKEYVKRRFVIIEGESSEVELNEIYNCCDIGLTTTAGEGWGLIPCEMSLCKIPQLIPNYSSFMEIFGDGKVVEDNSSSASFISSTPSTRPSLSLPPYQGFIPTKPYTLFVGREYSGLPEFLKDLFIPLVKSYISHCDGLEIVDNLLGTNNIPTVFISLHGEDKVGGNKTYHLNYSNIIGHFKTIPYTMAFLKQYTFQDRFQIYISIDPEFLTQETKNNNIQPLYDSFSTKAYKSLKESSSPRHNYFLNLNQLKKYYDLSLGYVCLPSIQDVVDKLHEFYSKYLTEKEKEKESSSFFLNTSTIPSPPLLDEAKYCYDKVKQITDKQTIIQHLDSIIKTLIE